VASLVVSFYFQQISVLCGVDNAAFALHTTPERIGIQLPRPFFSKPHRPPAPIFVESIQADKESVLLSHLN
jgi:hypothetical protein